MIFMLVTIFSIFVVIIMILVEKSFTFLLNLIIFDLNLIYIALYFLPLLFKVHNDPCQWMGWVLGGMGRESYFLILILLSFVDLLPFL